MSEPPGDANPTLQPVLLEELNMSDDKETLKTVPLGELARSFADTTITPADRRANFQTMMTGRLAFLVWLLLAGVVIWHISYIGILLSSQTPEERKLPAADQKELLDNKITLINETAKTLYTFLGPLITAATGFYFGSAINKASENGD